MARKTPLTSVKTISEINLTPLMDLTFILLITFIITFPLIEQGIPVNLPRGEADDLDSDRTRTVTMDREGRLYLDELPVTREQLAERLAELGRSDPHAVVLVRADEDLLYGKMMEVLRLLREAGIARMALVTQADSGSPP